MVFLFTLLLLENIFEEVVPFLNYLDEVVALASILLILRFVITKKRINVDLLRIINTVFILILIGLLSNLIFRVQKNEIAILKDVIAISKFFAVYICGEIYYPNGISKKKNRYVEIISETFITVVFTFGVINLFHPIGMDAGIRYGIRTYQFLYTHSTFLVGSLVVAVSVLIKKNKNNKLFIVAGLISIVFTLRLKGFFYIAILIAISLVFKNRQSSKNIEIQSKKTFSKKTKRRILLLTTLSIFAAYFIGRNKIKDYYLWGLNAARSALYIVGLKIMFEYFPLGTGFGTFASSISGEYYSPLYSKYGIANTSGLQLSEGYPYIADTYWPYIFGQFGIFGLLVYIRALYLVLKRVVRDMRSDQSCMIATLSMFAYIISACFVESNLTNASIVLVALMLSVYLKPRSAVI